MVKSTDVTIAVVEDDRILRETFCDMLVEEGYQVVPCSSAADLMQFLHTAAVDMILLDLKLPDGSGFEVIKQVRATDQIPIVIVTGRGDEVDRIVGLEIGADDYLVKPVSVRELAARIRAILRRSNARPVQAAAIMQPRSGFRFQGWTLDSDRRKLHRPDGSQVVLTVAEFDLLLAMVSASGRVLSRDTLLDMTRRENEEVFDRAIDVLILRLRRKIEANPQQPQFIRTERGIGYIFNAVVERVS